MGGMAQVAQPMEPDELVDRWTLLPDELVLVQAKANESQLGFSLLLKFFAQRPLPSLARRR